MMKNLKSVSVQVIDRDIALLLPDGVYEIKQMESKSRLRKVGLLCVGLALFGIFGFGYFCSEKVCTHNNALIVIYYHFYVWLSGLRTEQSC